MKIRRGQRPPSKASSPPTLNSTKPAPTFCQRAVELIRNHADSNSGQPFFLYYASPHPPQPLGSERRPSKAKAATATTEIL